MSRSRSKLALALLLLAASPGAEGGEKLLPSFSEVRAGFESSEGRLLDRDGHLLHEQRVSMKGRTLGWVELKDTSPAFREALLHVEDRRFFSHSGVDLAALAGAAWQRLAYGSRRGASTVTMQLVNLLERAPGVSRAKRSLWGKVRQARLAWELENSWSKEQILEAYLNLVSFRGEHRGLHAASRALFAKDPHGLDLRESFLLATLLRAPAMSAEAAATRLCRYAGEVKGLGDCEGLRQLARASLSRPRAPDLRVQLAPHLASQLLGPGRREARSTLSLPLQEAALEAVRDQLLALQKQNARDAAVIVADNRTGEVLAYVGGSGSLSASPQVDMARALRQAGSTLKPFLFALAFEKGYLEPGSWLLDEPYEIGLDRGSYEPGNYDNQFHGPVTAQVALASSLNVPAVRAVGLVGVDAFQGFLQGLGFRALEEGVHYGPSLALGTADITLQDLVQAYMTLANGGRWKALRFVRGDGASVSRKVLSEKAASQVSAILSDRGFRALTFGWDSLLATPYPAAVKTGTSKDMRDNWCVGYSRDFTVGVWMGNGGGDPMWQVSGVSGAAPIWRTLMDRLHRGRPSKPFVQAPRIAGAEAPRFERARFGRILYPAQGAVLAVDPDIPPSRQRVALEAEGEGQLFLNGQLVQDSLWKPEKGRHHLKLSSRKGEVIDSVSFEVR
jgi:penicillin-binding protein 1C